MVYTAFMNDVYRTQNRVNGDLGLNGSCEIAFDTASNWLNVSFFVDQRAAAILQGKSVAEIMSRFGVQVEELSHHLKSLIDKHNVIAVVNMEEVNFINRQ